MLRFYAQCAWRFLVLRRPQPLIYGIAVTDRCNLACRGGHVSDDGSRRIPFSPDFGWKYKGSGRLISDDANSHEQSWSLTSGLRGSQTPCEHKGVKGLRPGPSYYRGAPKPANSIRSDEPLL